MTGIEEAIIAALIEIGLSETVAAFVLSTAINLAVTVAFSVVAGLFKSGTDQSRELTQYVRISDAPHRFIYGTRLASGLIAYIKTSADHKYLYMILVLAAHEVNAIGTIWFNDKEETDYNSSYFRVNKHLGTDDQAADADFVSELTEWTTAHQGKSRAYLAIRLVGSHEVWPTGTPLIRAVIDGKKVYDPRSGATAFSNNPALCIRDYILIPKAKGGFGADADEVDDDYFNIAASICEEQISVPTGEIPDSVAITGATQANPVRLDAVAHPFINGQLIEIDGVVGMTELNERSYTVTASSTDAFSLLGIDGTAYSAYASGGIAIEPLKHTTQNRFTLDGPIDTSLQPVDNLRQMLTSCRGWVGYVGGKYRLIVGSYTPPSNTITEDDLRGPFSIQANMPAKELYNGVRGRYPNPDEQYQTTDFPPMQNDSFIAADNGDELWRDVEFPYTTDVFRAQSLAQIDLDKSRRGRVISMPCKLTVLNVAVWDTVTVNLDSCPDVNGIYRIERFEIAPDGAGLGVDLIMREESPFDYSWIYTDAVLPTPYVDLTDATVSKTADPTGLSASTITTDAWNDVDVELTWDAVTFDGQMIADITHEVNYSGNPVQQTINMVSGQKPRVWFHALPAGLNVEFNVRHQNLSNRTPSDWVTKNYTTGSLDVPTDPTNLACADGAAGEIAVDWDESTGATWIILYLVQWKLTTDSLYSSKLVFPSDYLITGLTSSSTYDIRVRATYTNGQFSGWISTTYTAP